MEQRQPDPQTIIVTTAGLSGTEDRRLRQRNYVITQACRIVCFVLAVVLRVGLHAPLPVSLFFIVGAFVLPWMGVTAANGGPVKQKARFTNVVDHGSVEQAYDEPLRITYDASRTVDQD